jgi:signal transduction histidine kinase
MASIWALGAALASRTPEPHSAPVTAAPDPHGPPDARRALGHELRTPLAAIIGYADALRVQAFGPLSQTYVEAAESIHAAAGHMLALVERLTSGIEGDRQALAIERLDARRVANEAMRLVEPAPADLRLDAPEVFTVDADALALRQIMVNLIANAVAAGARNVTLSLEAAGADLVLTVDDDGPGVAGIVEGTGLALVRALVAAHGGAFSLTGRPEGGARARARLPVVARG